MPKSKFIRNLGQCRVNFVGADQYENADGSCTIRFDLPSKNIHRDYWLHFNSVDTCDKWLSSLECNNGYTLVTTLKEKAGIA